MDEAQKTMGIEAYSKTAAGLAELRTKYGGRTFDVGQRDGMRDALSARAELRGIRVNVEKLRVDLKAPLLEAGRQIDAEAKRITGELVALEDPIDAQIKTEERRKEAEKAKREAEERKTLAEARARIDAPRKAVARFTSEFNPDPEAIDVEIARLRSVDTSAFLTEEDRTEAAQIVGEAIATLEKLAAQRRQSIADRAAMEEERARLERERAELAAERAAAKRAADEERAKLEAEAEQAAKRAEAERLEAEEAARKAADEAARTEAAEAALAETIAVSSLPEAARAVLVAMETTGGVQSIGARGVLDRDTGKTLDPFEAYRAGWDAASEWALDDEDVRIGDVAFAAAWSEWSRSPK